MLNTLLYFVIDFCSPLYVIQFMIMNYKGLKTINYKDKKININQLIRYNESSSKTQCNLLTMELSVKQTDLLSECSLNFCILLDAVSPFIIIDLIGIRQVSSSGMSTALYFSNSSLSLYKFSYFLVSSSSFISFFMIYSTGI